MKSLENASEKNKNVVLINSLIPDDNVKYFFNSADFLIFNYYDVLTSGGVMLALSYNKKAIAPSMGCIAEIDDDNLILFDNQNDSTNLENTLLKFVKK